ncbi:MAG: L,D-transpeptidase [Zetaproteobacteria bacterium CG12_big_fil_rev_8_21_14_0_65_55_1124]|nr:MAG: L,D-transpeptidase [Zetaproteobacteria bacterium CG1_02_55_237]PIS20223.1 MAG: L,D-transpeptidase [Zetaproteobacteria bacterium CG08_land_8_20_14_0_20_55_17]PIW43380.1 MAG: L,D-transpeptidase [Zetaproteobacteria bacterium CG12_big_fil_rev_8_21_14_0_65_55_1124]PIY53087.1 MAG: L,D-transpeptidase [Zetaproteobacteria bacterium CG_4_10_14_0_8_um_filter_55_43]PIZ39996.1 MAG: L,D-transpeptidase [Zetaproteobacteria bacterium CG_4_10_14_0_2_um_filter_55_20]PJB81282.1 MAG: L,D-transpeptidase [Ze
MITVSITRQILIHRRPSGVCVQYPVSTAEKGCGNVRNSLQTPLGRHRIAAKIGEDFPVNTIFVARQPVGVFDATHDDAQKDWILSRILWLEGSQTGINRRGRVDTLSRYIYIHGTHRADLLGQPASHGCIRMRNEDVIDLFDHASEGEIVYIRL